MKDRIVIRKGDISKEDLGFYGDDELIELLIEFNKDFTETHLSHYTRYQLIRALSEEIDNLK